MLPRSILLSFILPCAVLCAPRSHAAASRWELRQDDEAELAAARADLDRARRVGDPSALGELRSWVDEEPEDARTRRLYGLALCDVGRWREAQEQLERAVRDAARLAPPERAACARARIELALTLGEVSVAQEVVQAHAGILDPKTDARDAWVMASTLRAAGQREAADELARAGRLDDAPDWTRALARARCERFLGDLVAASASLVRADELCGARREPDVLVELAGVYFEADGEIEHQEARRRVPGELYRAALAIHKRHAGALLGLFELGRFNWNRQNTPAHEWLAQLLEAVPDSISGMLAAADADLDDGRLPAARATLERVRTFAPAHRELLTLDAALAWVEHRREECEALLARLTSADALDARPERELARHLSELYRFAESVPFGQRATARDPSDHLAWLELGRALSNIGDEQAGLEALKKSEELAEGRQNAWRHNSILVLERIAKQFVVERGGGQLSYAWAPQAANVLRTYWMPFYESAREELSRRYAFTPSEVMIEVFDRFQDFSVRSTGFEGFPALGVCFGPVVTSVAPHSELRGKFSWARTSFHEFTHVIHLGLSHNRCPRWITEGLATWEEEHKNPAWTRNMRRDLLDAYHNRDLIAVRDLNRAFRSQRILFGYYMSGQLCRMLIEERGFAPMIQLLAAFDRGDDLDQAIQGVFGLSPEALDREFAEFVRQSIEPLRIEPRWTMGSVARAKLAVGDSAPKDAARQSEWRDTWCTVAWGQWQNGRRVDAEQVLRKLAQTGELPPRALYLQADMARQRGEIQSARELYERALNSGVEDFMARMQLGKWAFEAEEWNTAETHFAAAERAYPGFPDAPLSAERYLATVYEKLGREDQQFEVLERWLAWDSDDYPVRLRVAQRHAAQGRHERALRFFAEANEIDPFRRALHLEWGKSLSELARHVDAAREFRAALEVPPELDADGADPWSDARRAEVLGREAHELLECERTTEAERRAKEALELDADEARARAVLERLARGS